MYSLNCGYFKKEFETLNGLTMDIEYYKQYAGEDYGKKPLVEVPSIVKYAIDDWNQNADKENSVKGFEVPLIMEKAAIYYIKSGGYLDFEIVQAFISEM